MNFVAAIMVASVSAASLATALNLPTSLLPIVFLLLSALLVAAVQKALRDTIVMRLTVLEKLAMAFAGGVSLLRLAPYLYQYLASGLVDPVTRDDYWHFQEVASLVNSPSFPPHLNFHPDTYFHFYYVSWIPAAAFSKLADLLFGRPFIAATYAIDAMLLNLASMFIVLAFIRHCLEPASRPFAMAALVIAGAAVEFPFAIGALGSGPQHIEWWQERYGVHNQFSSLTTLLEWVPHHLSSACAILLAVILATEPGTLKPRPGLARYVVVGGVLAFAAYSSIFAFVGGCRLRPAHGAIYQFATSRQAGGHRR